MKEEGKKPELNKNRKKSILITFIIVSILCILLYNLGKTRVDYKKYPQLKVNLTVEKAKQRDSTLYPVRTLLIFNKLRLDSAIEKSIKLGDKKNLERLKKIKIKTITENDPDFLLYNGNFLIWFRDYKEFKRFPATSGQDCYQFARFQKVKDEGPIPEGSYTINLSLKANRFAQVSKDGDIIPGEGIQKIPEISDTNWGYDFTEDWGTMRARLIPDYIAKNKYNRGNFYIHNSNKGYSSGCIESGYKNQLFPMLIEYGKTQPKISVIVKYLGPNSSTFGDTNV